MSMTAAAAATDLGSRDVLDDQDARVLADALVANRAALIAAEARELELAAAWADTHPVEAHPSPVLPGTERPRQFGGDGTPEAGEFAAAELAVLLGLSLAAAGTLIADALDLRHRHPLLWRAVTAGHVRVWQARHVARRTRTCGLSLAQARAVDVATTSHLASLPFGRFRELLEARIIAADPARAEARAEAEALDRYVTTGQSEHGHKTLIARATAGEIIYLVAVVDRIAEVLLHRGDTRPVGVRRSKALGLLAHPARVLELLGEDVAEDISPPPTATLYVHVSRETFVGDDEACGVARVEDVGAITVGQVRELLGETAARVVVRPVLDLADESRPVDCYEATPRLREQMVLRQPTSAFPWSPATSRRMDLDHTTGWAPGTAATRIANLGRLTRTEHRVKTHAAGWQHRQPRPGVHLWRTPTGHHYRVDPTGTHAVPEPTVSALEHAFWEIVIHS
jgi:hypothetical protein